MACCAWGTPARCRWWAACARLRGYLAAQSGVRLELTQQSSEQQLADLAEGRLDLGLLRLPVLRQHPRLHLRALYREPLLLALAADHPLARREAPWPWPPWPEKPSSPFPTCNAAASAIAPPNSASAPVSTHAWRARAVAQDQPVATDRGRLRRRPGAASMRAIAPPAVRFMSLTEAEAYSEVALAWRRDDSPWWKASSNISWRICRTKPRIDRTSRCAALSCRPCVTIPSNGSASIARC